MRLRLRDWLTGRISRFLTHPVGRYEQRYHNDPVLLKRHIRKGDVLLVEHLPPNIRLTSAHAASKIGRAGLAWPASPNSSASPVLPETAWTRFPTVTLPSNSAALLRS